jgi:hypothetical protein
MTKNTLPALLDALRPDLPTVAKWSRRSVWPILNQRHASDRDSQAHSSSWPRSDGPSLLSLCGIVGTYAILKAVGNLSPNEPVLGFSI